MTKPSDTIVATIELDRFHADCLYDLLTYISELDADSINIIDKLAKYLKCDPEEFDVALQVIAESLETQIA